MFDYNFFIEAFGYTGTALVIISMLMTSVVKLRVINICGSVISAAYACISGTWPIVLLNVALVLINTVQLIRMKGSKVPLTRLVTAMDDKSTQYFLSLYEKDIKMYVPEYTMPKEENTQVNFACMGSELVGVLIGEIQGDTMHIFLDYATPKYRDLSVSTFLFSTLKKEGVRKLIAPSGNVTHQKYLLRMGFSPEGTLMSKQLNLKEI